MCSFNRLSCMVCVGLLLSCAVAQAPYDPASTHVKREYMIPMRDGVRLYTAVFLPKDTAGQSPILLSRTPYSCAPYGVDSFPSALSTQFSRYLREGYIIALQDVRGRYMSEGEFVDVRPFLPEKTSRNEIDESSDTFDTIDWLLNTLRHTNGKVGMIGLSYGGFYTWMGTLDAHPALKVASPQAPVSKWMGGDDFFHNGAFLLPHAFNFYGWFGWPRPHPKKEPDPSFDHGTSDEYKFFLQMGPLGNANKKYFHDSVAFWNTMMANGTWNAFWAARNILQHLKGNRPATLVVGGWFDTENLFGALNSYAAKEQGSPGSVNVLVMGPWSHGQWRSQTGDSLGEMQWGSPTATFFVDSIEFPFVNHYLNNGPPPGLAEASVFDTGLRRWRRFECWPPRGEVDSCLYLREGGSLSFERPLAGEEEFDEYVNDPARPVPYTAETTNWYNPAFMCEDQRFASRRPDVLVYQTDELRQDLTVAGPIDVQFIVSTTGTDADWVVKVIDVFPDSMGRHGGTGWFQGGGAVPLGGYQMLVRGDVLRGKFRDGIDRTVPFAPLAPTPISFRLQDIFHTFRAGHRVMVQVQSSWFPMIDRNPGTYCDIYSAEDGDFRKTTQRVYRSGSHASRLELRVVR